MDDFVSRYRSQLLSARRRRRPSLSSSLSRPTVTALVGLSLVAGAAAATTTPWLPDLGQDHDREFATAASPPPEAQLRALGVLRREQTDADRKIAQAYALRFFGDNTGSVRTDFVRSHAGSADSAVVLVPVTSYQVTRAVPSDAGPPTISTQTEQNGLCLFIGDNGAGGGQACQSLADLEAGRIRGALASRDSARFYGLVPDMVKRVRVGRSGESPMVVDVHENLYDFTLTPASQGAAITIEELDWLDQSGRVVKSLLGWSIGGPPRPATQVQCADGRIIDVSEGDIDGVDVDACKG